MDLYGELLKITGGKERMSHFIAHYQPQMGGWAGREETLIPQLHARKTELFQALLNQGQIPLRPGIARILQEARTAGVRLAIATTTTPGNVDSLLTATLGAEATGWFEVIGAGDVVAAKKPAPDIYTYVLEKLGLEPHSCLAIEDSEMGLQAAVGAGIPTLITSSFYTQAHDFAQARMVVDHLGDAEHPRASAPPVIELASLLRQVAA